jgi:hypothetical protein
MPTRSRDLLDAALNEQFVGEEGELLQLLLVRPGFGPNERNFQSRFTRPLPPEVSELLSFASGFRLGYVEIFFTEYALQGYHFLLPDWMELCGDGFGNFWVAEIQADSNEWAPVWFVCHDPPVIVRVADTLSDFIDQVLDCSRKPPRLQNNWFARSHDRADKIWQRGESAGISALAGCSSTDATISAFARSLPKNGVIVDLRSSRLGDGFSWAQFDAYAEAKRAHPLIWGFMKDQ